MPNWATRTPSKTRLLVVDAVQEGDRERFLCAHLRCDLSVGACRARWNRANPKRKPARKSDQHIGAEYISCKGCSEAPHLATEAEHGNAA